MLLVKEHRNCLTGLNLWTSVSSTLLAVASSQCFSRSWVQLSPQPLLKSSLLQRRGKKKEEVPSWPPAGISFWPEAQIGYSQSIFAFPASSAVNKHEAARPLKTKPRAFCVSACYSSQSQGAVTLPATFGKGCGRVTAVFACVWWSGEGSHTAQRDIYLQNKGPAPFPFPVSLAE